VPRVLNLTGARLHADAVLTCDAAMTLHRPGTVDIDDDGRIKWSGPTGDAPARAPGVEHRVEGLLMPGLVNAHGHAPMIALRGLGEGLPLHRWLTEVMWPREARLRADDIVAATSLAASEYLCYGVTTTCEMYFHPARIATALRSAGMRGVVAAAIMEAAPEWLGDWRSQLDGVARFVEECPSDPLITPMIGAHSAYLVGDDALRAVGDLARLQQLAVTIHVAESAHESDSLSAAHGGASVPRLLADLGLFDGVRVLAAHAVWLDDADIELFARHGVAVAHCPGSNAKLASGTARVRDLRTAGVPVALGTDGAASGDDLDIWEEARLAALLARLQADDATALQAADAIAMATREGAAALGVDAGTLAPGRFADILRIDLRDPGFVPHLDDADLLAHLLWSVPRRAIRDVWVAGRHVVVDGECTTVDVDAAAAAVQATAARIAG